MHLKTQLEGSGSPVKLEGPSAAPRILSSKTKRKMVFWGVKQKKTHEEHSDRLLPIHEPSN